MPDPNETYQKEIRQLASDSRRMIREAVYAAERGDRSAALAASKCAQEYVSDLKRLFS
jgi:vacuolar-type H+-ATPase subunit H